MKAAGPWTRRAALGLPLAGWLAVSGCASVPARLAQTMGRPWPDKDQALHRVAVGSCCDLKRGVPIWGSVLAAQPDLMIYGGDNVYASQEPWSLQQLLSAYAQLAAHPDFARLRAQVRSFAIWDDHDYGLNDGGAAFAHKQASKEAFLTFWQVSPDDPRRSREGIYTAETFGPPGRRVQIIGLDNRWFLSPWRPTDQRNAPGKERYLPDPDPAKTMLGTAQWAWLEEQLRQAADVRLIVSGLQIVAEGHGFERWGNFPREQERLYQTIARTGARGVILLSGDRHLGAFYRQTRGVAYPLWEMTSSGITHPWTTAAEPGPNRVGDLVRVKHFGSLDFDWEARRVHMALRDEQGHAQQEVAVSLAELQST